MTYYLVKETSKSRLNNRKVTAWFGKEGCLIAMQNEYEDYTPYSVPWSVANHGYKRECDAKRSYIYKNTENSPHFLRSVEIVEIEV